jgi:hypothetical protein
MTTKAFQTANFKGRFRAPPTSIAEPLLPQLTRDELIDAVTAGVRAAVYDAISSSSDRPTRDFFEAVQAGMAEGVKHLQRHEVEHADPS